MPWSLSDAPKGTDVLPLGAKRIFIATANKILADSGDDEQAMIAGWSAVKRHYAKGPEGRWSRKTADADTAIANALIAVSAPDIPHETLEASLATLVGPGQFDTVEAAGGMGRNDGDAAGAGPGGKCVCPNCDYTTTHATGEACNDLKCAECGATMTRDEAVESDASAVSNAIIVSDSEGVTDSNDHFPIPDIAHARNALRRVARFEASPSWWGGELEVLQAEVRRAVYAKFPSLKTKDLVAGAYALLPDVVAEAEPAQISEVLAHQITDASSIEVVAGVGAAVPAFGAFMTARDIETLQAAAEQKLSDLASVGREAMMMPFATDAESFDFDDDGEVLSFEAVVGQVDTPLVPRMVNADDATPVVFPRESIEANFARLDSEIEMGRLFGEADHPPDGKPRIRETCVVFDEIALDGNDIVVKGRTTKNAAGRDVRDLALTPINLEFSLRGWGKPTKSKWEGEGDFKDRECIVAEDFILRTFDVVTTGLATTGLTSVAADDGGIPMDASKDEQTEEETSEETTEEETTEEETADEFVENQLDPEADLPAGGGIPPVVPATADAEKMISRDDVAAIVADGVKAGLQQHATTVEIVAEVSRVKARAGGDEAVEMLLDAQFAGATSAAEVIETEGKLGSIFERLSDPATGVMAGQGVTAGVPTDKPINRFMADGEGNVVARPATIQGVRELLMAGIDDNGQDNPSNDRFNMNVLLDNYEGNADYQRYLYTNTKSGYASFEAASQTTALMGTQTPQVLPLLRYLYPKLFARKVASVQPMKQPTATVYWMRFQKMDGSTYTEERSNFDYDWADRATEATTKKQLGLQMSQANISAGEKSIYYDLAQEVVQDMAAVHGVNAQAELLKEAANEIAREVNYEMLYDMWDNSTGSSQTYGTQLPATGWTNLRDWYQMLITFVNKAAAEIRRDNAMGPNWLVVDPMAAALLSVLDTYETDGDFIEDEFGVGLKKVGTLAKQYTVYQADWFTENRIMLGYKGASWSRAGYVYAPYIPLYTSPIDYDAPTNTVAQSVTSRYGVYYPRPGLFGKVTIADATGTNPF